MKDKITRLITIWTDQGILSNVYLEGLQATFMRKKRKRDEIETVLDKGQEQELETDRHGLGSNLDQEQAQVNPNSSNRKNKNITLLLTEYENKLLTEAQINIDSLLSFAKKNGISTEDSSIDELIHKLVDLKEYQLIKEKKVIRLVYRLTYRDYIQILIHIHIQIQIRIQLVVMKRKIINMALRNT